MQKIIQLNETVWVMVTIDKISTHEILPDLHFCKVELALETDDNTPIPYGVLYSEFSLNQSKGAFGRIKLSLDEVLDNIKNIIILLVHGSTKFNSYYEFINYNQRTDNYLIDITKEDEEKLIKIIYLSILEYVKYKK